MLKIKVVIALAVIATMISITAYGIYDMLSAPKVRVRVIHLPPGTSVTFQP